MTPRAKSNTATPKASSKSTAPRANSSKTANTTASNTRSTSKPSKLPPKGVVTRSRCGATIEPSTPNIHPILPVTRASAQPNKISFGDAIKIEPTISKSDPKAASPSTPRAPTKSHAHHGNPTKPPTSKSKSTTPPSHQKPPVASSSKATTHPPTKKRTKTALDRLGGNRATEEDAMIAEHAQACLETGILDKHTATQMARPWHEKGELETPWWKPEHLALLNPHLATAENIMDLKEAEAVRRQRDLAEKRFLCGRRAGLLNEDGHRTAQPDGKRQASSESSREEEEEEEEEKEEEEEEGGGGGAEKAKHPAPFPDFPAQGRPNYSQYTYNQCAAICAQRNITAKGSVVQLRGCLIQDDYNVDNGLERDARNYFNKRVRRTTAPVVLGAPAASPARSSSKRSSEENNGSEGCAKRQKKSA